MADVGNVDKPFGATPIGTTDGSDWHGKLRQVAFSATTDTAAVFLNDFVTLSALGSDTTGKLPFVKLATAGSGNPLIGSLVSLVPDFANESFITKHRLASTARTGYVAWGSQVLYIMQEDSDGNSIEATEANNNVNLATITAGNTTTGVSDNELDSSSAATGATLQLRLHHVYDTPGNLLGDNAVWVVSINNDADSLVALAGI